MKFGDTRNGEGVGRVSIAHGANCIKLDERENPASCLGDLIIIRHIKENITALITKRPEGINYCWKHKRKNHVSQTQTGEN